MTNMATTVENVQTTFDMPFFPGSVKTHMRDIESGRADIWRPKVDDIKVLPGFNPRIQNEEYESHVESLAGLIFDNGFRTDRPLSGIVLKVDGKDQLFIYDGHCRLEGAKRAIARGAEIERLPVVAAPKGTSLEDITAEVANSNTGKHLTPLEVGVVCKRLIGFGWDSSQIAKRLSITGVYVDQLLMVIASPLKIREMIQAGKVSLSTALDALRKHGDKAIEVLEGSLSKAEMSGKGRVTASMLPGAKRKAEVRKAAPQLHDVARRVTQDPAFAKLDEGIRADLMALLDRIKAAEPETIDQTSNAQEVDQQAQATARIIPFAA